MLNLRGEPKMFYFIADFQNLDRERQQKRLGMIICTLDSHAFSAAQKDLCFFYVFHLMVEAQTSVVTLNYV